MCVSSNRTLTAKFVNAAAILYIHIVDETLDVRGGSLGYLADYDGQELTNYTDQWVGGYQTRVYTFYKPMNTEAIPYGKNEFLGYYESYGSLIDENPTIDESDMGLIFEPGQHIYASFSGEATPGGTPSQVTIRLDNTDGSPKGGKGKVGFSPSNLSLSQTKTVNYGEEVTIYAEGDEIVGDYNVTHYYCTGFYLDSGSALKTFSDNARLHSYTFTATRDMDISAIWKKYE